ncbi:MAG TPA: HprK-related kinase A [Sedimenticola sp.]|nr:HprK-related kinase A [Sedimenticola sp.]
MKLSDLSPEALSRTLRRQGVGIEIGPFRVRIRSPLHFVSHSLRRLYPDYPLVGADEFHDFHCAIDHPGLLRRPFRPQAQFFVDGEAPFKPLPLNQAFPFFEWGLNWCIAQYAHQYLLLHAAVVERGGLAVILPGSPGAGKSTLCASLVARGWRLLSDEMAAIPETDNRLLPIPRPVSLKNSAIGLMKSFAPNEVFGDSFHDTAKGTVAHMRAPAASVQRATETARPRLVVFPRYDPASSPLMTPVTRPRAFLRLVEHAFNYDFLGVEGFRRMNRLLGGCDCYDFTYPSIEEGLAGLSTLWREIDGEAVAA